MRLFLWTVCLRSPNTRIFRALGISITLNRRSRSESDQPSAWNPPTSISNDPTQHHLSQTIAQFTNLSIFTKLGALSVFQSCMWHEVWEKSSCWPQTHCSSSVLANDGMMEQRRKKSFSFNHQKFKISAHATSPLTSKLFSSSSSQQLLKMSSSDFRQRRPSIKRIGGPGRFSIRVQFSQCVE